MIPLLRWSSGIYQRLLWMYPEDLRLDFGEDMVRVFAEDLAESWADAGITGVVQVWRSVACELMHIALPSLASTPSFIVPATCFALSAVSFSIELGLARAQASPSVPGWPLLEATRTVVLWPSVTAALVSFTVVRLNARSRTVSLQLCSTRGLLPLAAES